MAEFLSNIKTRINGLLGSSEEPLEMGEAEPEYVELDTSSSQQSKKIIVRPFVLNTFEDVKEVLDGIRNGSIIALINIKQLKEQDINELKRAVAKLKKTVDAISGDLAGLGEDYIVVTPGFAKIYRDGEGETQTQQEPVQEEP